MTGHTKFDFIGDIHGHAETLKKLLEKLGYFKEQGVYMHANRQAFFVGDFIDRGPEVLEVLEIVKDMVDAGSALAVMGNHEYNFIQLHTPSTDDSTKMARPAHKRDQAKSTFEAFGDDDELLQKYLAWFKTLPLYFESDHFRVVHAQWDDYSIEKIKKYCYSDNGCDCTGILNEEYFSHTRGEVHDAVEILLKGYEHKLKDGNFFHDHYGKERTETRIRWWERGDSLSLKDVVDYGVDLNAEDAVESYGHSNYKQYGLDDLPVFFGHYCLKTEYTKIALRQNNICCLDFCVTKGGNIVAYRFNGEQQLNSANLIY